MKSYYEMGKFLDQKYSWASHKITTEHEPCYFYHISNRPLTGLELDETPFDLYPKYIESGECDLELIQRICVAPTIEQCLVAIASKGDPQFYIYRTTRTSTKSSLPFGVLDAPLSQERWFRHKRQFKLVGLIPSDDYSIYNKDETSKTEYLADFRGDDNTFHIQYKELLRLKSFFKRHEAGFFFNDMELAIHRQQRNLKLKVNRYELRQFNTTACSPSFN